MNFLIAIVTKEDRLFSTYKNSTPKMINVMKELAKQYSETFGSEYKVVRFLKTSKGLKRI